MIKYSELIKTEIAEIPEKQKQKVLKAAAPFVAEIRYRTYMVTTSDNVEYLAFDIYKVFKQPAMSSFQLIHRHFVSKAPEAQYVTYNPIEGTRSKSSLRSCLTSTSWYYNYSEAKPFSDNDTKLVKAFAENIAKSNYYCPNALDVMVTFENSIDIRKERIRAEKIFNANQKRMEQLNEIPQKFDEWIEGTIMRRAQYFFYKTSEKGKARGFCSYCRKRFTASGVRQGKKIVCPSCKTEISCKSHAKTDCRLLDTAFVSCVDRITEDEKPVFVLRYFRVDQYIENWKLGLKKMAFKLRTDEYLRIFLNGKTLEKQKLKGRWLYTKGYNRNGEEGWVDIKHHPHSFHEKNWCYPGNLNEIAQEIGDRVKNIDFEDFANHVERDFYAICITLWHFPIAENFVKQGLSKFAKNIVQHGFGLIGAYINHNEMSVAKFLGVGKPTVRSFSKMDISDEQFVFYKEICNGQQNAVELFKQYMTFNATKRIDEIKAIQEYNISSVRLLNYLSKQVKLTKTKGYDLIQIYRDYLSMAEDMKFDMTNDSILFPKNVRKEHDELMVIKETRANKAFEAKLRRRTKKLEMLSWSNDDFIIRPLRNSKEFVNESNVLQHCVKTYIKRCSNGETNIFGIRKASKPDEPYFTLTLTNAGNITMNHGKRNCSATPEVKKFADEWHRKVVVPNLEKFIKLVNPNAKKKQEQERVRIGA